MGAPVEFRERKPSDTQSNPKVDDDTASEESPAGSDKLPVWAKWVIGCNVIMIHLVVILVGVMDVPFALNDAVLVAYVVTGLGMPIGLASHAVRGALAGLFGVKT